MKNGWHEGVVGIPTKEGRKTAHYWVKAYEKRSRYGINGGRISKLELHINDRVAALYDRGWDIEPDENDEAAQVALYICLDQYN